MERPDERGVLWALGSIFGFILFIILFVIVSFFLFWFIAVQWNVWRYGPHSHGAAEIEAATAEAIYQPIIDGAELKSEQSIGAYRDRRRGDVPTRVDRAYVVTGGFVDTAQAYVDEAVAHGWVLQESECSIMDRFVQPRAEGLLVSSLRFTDPDNESRGEVLIEFSPHFPRSEMTSAMKIDVQIDVQIRVTDAPARATVVFRPPTCLDDFVQAIQANGPPRTISSEETLERITPELLAASGVGEQLVGTPVNSAGVQFRQSDGQSVLDINNAEWYQTAPLWDREADEVFSFTDDGGDAHWPFKADPSTYWHVPVDGGVLILAPDEGVTHEAMLNLGLALQGD